MVSNQVGQVRRVNLRKTRESSVEKSGVEVRAKYTAEGAAVKGS